MQSYDSLPLEKHPTLELDTAIDKHPALVDEERSRSGAAFVFTIVRALFLSSEMRLQNLIGFLAARAGFLGDLFPFGPAFFVAVLIGGDRKRTVAAAISVLAGAATAMPGRRMAGLAAVTALCLVLGGRLAASGKRRHGRAVGTALAVAALFGIARLATEWFEEISLFDVLSTSVEAGLIALVALIAAPAVASTWLESERYDRSNLLALGMLVALGGLGLTDLTWSWVLAAEVWNRLVVLVAALIGGAAGGAAVGTAVGVLSSLAGWMPVGGPGLYGVAGLAAGLFARRGKLGTGTGFALGQAVVAAHAESAGEIIWGAAHTAVALLLFALISRRWLSRLQRAVPGSDAHGSLQLAKERRLRSAINERLRQVSSVLEELADVFRGRPSPGEAKASEDGIHAILRHAWTHQCQGCSGFKTCWEHQFYNSYWDTVDLVAAAERKGRAVVEDMPAGLAGRCVHPREFVSAINAARASNSDGDWSLAKFTAMDVVPQQLEGAAELMKSVADQVKLDTGRAEALEARLWEEISLRRIDVRQVRVLETGDHPEIEVEYSGECDGYGSCSVPLLGVVERLFADRYTCEIRCRSGLEHSCHVRLIPEPPLKVEVEIARCAKGETLICGDSCARVELGGGKTALALSDGMGAGDRAAVESRATIGMLEKMMRAGFDRVFAARTINSVLLLRSSEEMYATLDLAVIDRFTGEVEFLKVGSSPTFIKRGRDVEVVRSNTLPVGILNEIAVDVTSRRLEPGAVLIMMTDGILDSLPHQADKEEWIARMLRRVETSDPKELVRLLVERAKQASGGRVGDDMTVVVAKLELVKKESSADGAVQASSLGRAAWEPAVEEELVRV